MGDDSVDHAEVPRGVFIDQKPGKDGDSFLPIGWAFVVEDAFVVRPAGDPDCLKFHYFTKKEDDEPKLSEEEEIREMNRQIFASEGFDIDYSKFRCLFNYHLVDPEDYDFREFDDLNNGQLLDILTKESLRRYNINEGTEFEFVKVEKAQFHACNGYMFLITFQVLDPSDRQEQTFQARVRYTTRHPAQYVFCRPKPPPQVDTDDSSMEDEKAGSDETSEEDAKVDSDDTS